MDIDEALEWLRGKRSMVNSIPSDQDGSWQVRVALGWPTQAEIDSAKARGARVIRVRVTEIEGDPRE